MWPPLMWPIDWMRVAAASPKHRATWRTWWGPVVQRRAAPMPKKTKNMVPKNSAKTARQKFMDRNSHMVAVHLRLSTRWRFFKNKSRLSLEKVKCTFSVLFKCQKITKRGSPFCCQQTWLTKNAQSVQRRNKISERQQTNPLDDLYQAVGKVNSAARACHLCPLVAKT